MHLWKTSKPLYWCDLLQIRHPGASCKYPCGKVKGTSLLCRAKACIDGDTIVLCDTHLDSKAHRAAKRGFLPALPHADSLPAIISGCGMPE